jgi:type VI secretion system protein VasD
MTRRRQVAPVGVAFVVLAFAGLVTSACAGTTPVVKAPEKCPPQSITVSVLSSAAINRTPEGEPRPVVVRLYQLKADARLYNASFDRIWKDDKATLADDLVSSQEVEVYPGTRTDVKFERPPTVNHVAGVALFSNPTGHAWFASLDLPPVPEAGKCGAACPPGDDDCESANVLTPHFIYYVDGSKIDDGVEHIDDYPTEGRMKAKK